MARRILAGAPGEPWVPMPGGVVTTGVGSSEAHARYLAALLRRCTDVPSWFEPLSAFLDPAFPGRTSRDRTLVVFSQGLGANARMALERRAEFGSVVVVTSATEEGQARAGRRESAGLLARLREERARVEGFPVEDEFTILIRVIGPLCGFAAAWRLASGIRGHGLMGGMAMADALEAWNHGPWAGRLASGIREAMDAHRAGFVLATSEALGGCVQNVVAKFVEGLYWPGPRVVDLLGLAHGVLQQLVSKPSPVWVFGDDALAAVATSTLAGAGIPARRVPLPTSFELAPLAAELLVNPVLMGMVEDLGIDQLNWPGKGLDGGLYGISRREDMNETGSA